MKRILQENWLMILVVAVLIGGYVFLRTPGDGIESTEAFDTMVTDGTPTLVQFYSNACGACLLAKPAFDRIERDLGDRVQFVRLSVVEGAGRELAVRYGVRSLPTLIVLDGNGLVVLKQAGRPSREDVLSAVDRLG